MLESFLFKSHALAGLLTLLFGTLNLLNKKGGKFHKRIGIAYMLCMGWIFVSALLIIAFIHFNFFLMVIAVFSFYLCFSGYRVLKRKKAGKVKPVDWIAATLTLLFGIYLLGMAVYLLVKGNMLMGILSILFGFGTANTAWNDIKIFRKTEFDEKQWWWYHHMQAMCASMIAAVTAFLVQNGGKFFPNFEQQWIFWLLPTVIATPLLTIWIKSYRKKFAGESNQKFIVRLPPKP